MTDDQTPPQRRGGPTGHGQDAHRLSAAADEALAQPELIVKLQQLDAAVRRAALNELFARMARIADLMEFIEIMTRYQGDPGGLLAGAHGVFAQRRVLSFSS